jgi:hypothetical protein
MDSEQCGTGEPALIASQHPMYGLALQHGVITREDLRFLDDLERVRQRIYNETVSAIDRKTEEEFLPRLNRSIPLLEELAEYRHTIDAATPMWEAFARTKGMTAEAAMDRYFTIEKAVADYESRVRARELFGE